MQLLMLGSAMANLWLRCLSAVRGAAGAHKGRSRLCQVVNGKAAVHDIICLAACMILMQGNEIIWPGQQLIMP